MMIDPLSVPTEGIDPLDRQEGSSKDAQKQTPAENPFEDFQFVGPSDKGKNVAGIAFGPELKPERLPLSESGSLLSDSSSSRWTDSPDRDSVSNYSDRSSQSLFYLEKTNSR